MRRRIVSAGTITLLAAASLWAQDTALQTHNIPAAAAIIQRYVEVTGGKAAYDAIKTEVSTGAFSIVGAGIQGVIKEYSASPAKAYAVMDIPGVGRMEEGSDGNIAWENSAIQGARILKGDEAAAALRKAAADVTTNWQKYYKSAEVAGTETVDSKTCFKVIMKPLKGPTETDYYDKESGLLVKQTATYETPMGPVPAETSISDYRKVGDLTLPFHIEQKMAGQVFDIKLEKIVLNPDIPGRTFDPPPEIRALQK